MGNRLAIGQAGSPLLLKHRIMNKAPLSCALAEAPLLACRPKRLASEGGGNHLQYIWRRIQARRREFAGHFGPAVPELPWIFVFMCREKNEHLST